MRVEKNVISLFLISFFIFVILFGFTYFQQESSIRFSDSTTSSVKIEGDEPPYIPPKTGGGGGGGGRPLTPLINFEFSPDFIQEKLEQGDEITKTINITNIGRTNIAVNLSVLNLNNLIFLNPTYLELKTRESKQFEALISTSETTEPDVYLGDIIGRADDVEKNLPIVLRVMEKEADIVLNINIKEDNKVIPPGKNIIADINITNKLNKINIPVTYSIRDRDNNIVSSWINILDINPGRNVFSEEYQTENNIEPGYYIFHVNVTVDSHSYVDADSFRVIREETPGFAGMYIVYIIIAIVVLSSLFFLVTRKPRKKRPIQLKEEKIIINFEEIIKDTTDKLKKLKLRKYDNKSLETYSKIMREFFSDVYSIKSSLTFQEIARTLAKKKVNRKSKVIRFVNKIANVPYSGKLISKAKFDSLIAKSMRFVSSYRAEIPPKKK